MALSGASRGDGLELDTKTLAILLTSGGFLRVFLLCHFAAHRKTYKGFKLAIVAEVVGIVGMVVNLHTGSGGSVWAMLGRNLPIFVYMLLFFEALAQYGDAPRRKPAFLAGCVIIVGATMALLWFYLVEPDIVMRSIIHSGVNCLFFFRMAIEFPLVARRRLHGMYIIALSALVSAVLSGVRVWWLTGQADYSGWLVSNNGDYWLDLLLMQRGLHTCVELYAFLSMTSHRIEGELHEAQAELADLAFHDPLTGLLNRRGFESRAECALRVGQRYGHEATLVMLDIDHFKAVNDCHGHMVGDELLREMAVLCQGAVRDVDVLARIGGEEFVLLLPQVSGEGGAEAAERLRQLIRNHAFGGERMLHMTASFGIVSGSTSLADLRAAADACLYTAKRSGRDQCVMAVMLGEGMHDACGRAAFSLSSGKAPGAGVASG